MLTFKSFSMSNYFCESGLALENKSLIIFKFYKGGAPQAEDGLTKIASDVSRRKLIIF